MMLLNLQMDKALNILTKKRLAMALSLLGMGASLPVLADSFVIKDVAIEGIERIGYETVYTYLPVSVGDRMTPEQQQASLKALYRTGFFQDIALFRGDNDQLVIKVVERPSISEVKMEGNRLIKTDDLKKALDALGIKQGKIFNAIEMDRVILDLKRQYHNQGYYAADVKITPTVLPRNRVEIKIEVDEGEAASIERITLVGNESYSDERLKELFLLSESVMIGSGDKYARPKLQSDLETLRSFYMDRGFAEFNIDSSQVSLSPDKTKVFITASMTEGPQYRLNTIEFSGETKLNDEQLQQLVNLKTGELFSRSKIVAAVSAIQDRLSEEGYAFALVEPGTELMPEKRLVDLNFYIEPKNRVYVRKIEVEGNTRTRDHVLRREVRQLESAPYSLALVRQSTERLNRLGYFSKVDIETRRVSEDEVDLVVVVEEQPTGSFTAGVGYSQLDGVSFNLGIAERNFLGSGNEVNLTASKSASTTSADIGFFNPYFTDDGIGFGAGVFLTQLDASRLDIADYHIDNMGVRTNIAYPTSDLTRLNFGLTVMTQTLKCQAFNDCTSHVNQYGKDDTSLRFNTGWRYDSRNSFYFPSKGQIASLSLETVVPGSSKITFFKLYAEEKWYYPLSKNFTLKLTGMAAYGAGYGDLKALPFYERFYAGGIGSVRGYEPNSLGEYYNLTTDGSDRPKGGDVRTLGSAEIVFPMPFITDSSNIRMSWFFDMGNVFKGVEQVKFDQLRTSTGLSVSWLTPVGPLAFSFAQPINYEKSDKLQSFQFSLGVPF